MPRTLSTDQLVQAHAAFMNTDRHLTQPARVVAKINVLTETSSSTAFCDEPQL